MRRLLILAGLLTVVGLATSLGMTAQAVSSCTTTCSGATLFCAPVSSCSSVPGTSITCDGVTTSCSAASSWCACSNTCETNYSRCLSNCSPTGPPRCSLCDSVHTSCISSCGTRPMHISSC